MTVYRPPERFFVWREPLGRPECPYMYRWKLSLGPLGSIRLHKWVASDDKRFKHDHPADFVTLVLKGGYTDHSPCVWCKGRRTFHPLLPMSCPVCQGTGERRQRMTPGSIAHRRAEHQHTVVVDSRGAWTLVYFFPYRRDWGFWVPRKSDGKMKFKKSNKFFLEQGHHPCDQ